MGGGQKNEALFNCVYAVGVFVQEIELSEALCGFHRVIKTLDNREIVVMSHCGEVVKHGRWDRERSCGAAWARENFYRISPPISIGGMSGREGLPYFVSSSSHKFR